MGVWGKGVWGGSVGRECGEGVWGKGAAIKVTRHVGHMECKHRRNASTAVL